ncbi:MULTISPECIES: hypothetical protein [Rhizobium]|uniref:hypothetical protein n=1 Tax=Rhizobium TaxID=379 RepID=UPI001030D445|nr:MULTISPECIES: hypothetical protein [Rhizobium]TAX30786.1 hypothetical protein ELI04_13870 [Rhizobium leguminosarum]TBD43330.1 hypothetical protein ELH19_14410 [Rhizobium ruizarguesonis]
MTNGAKGDTAKIVCASACLGEFGCILIRGTTFAALFGSLNARSVRVGERGNDAGREKAEFQASVTSGVASVKNRHSHTRNSFLFRRPTLYGPGVAESPKSAGEVNEVRSLSLHPSSDPGVVALIAARRTPYPRHQRRDDDVLAETPRDFPSIDESLVSTRRALAAEDIPFLELRQ